jgi:hypothetical protein
MKSSELISFFTVTVVKLWHAIDGLYMYVFFLSHKSPGFIELNSAFLPAAGSLSQPLTTSGVYSEDINDTYGPYGYVAKSHFFRICVAYRRVSG